MGEEDRLEIFGYGSLLWKQDFKFSEKQKGYIKGYQRKFWQRNKTHRGTAKKVKLIINYLISRLGDYGISLHNYGKSAMDIPYSSS
jgi:cation transport protein ChaC